MKEKERLNSIPHKSKEINEQQKTTIKILVVTHKKYYMPTDSIYLPIQVGKAGKSLDLGIQTDDTGDNISAKNSNFCELTALYWGWKNLNLDYVGLAHYRRYFAKKTIGSKWSRILTKAETEELLQGVDVILPRKRRYYIESNYSHYVHGHKKESLDKTITIIKRDYSEYAKACDDVMKRSWAHMFNMFIMKKELLDDYCEWLFSILFKLEKELDISSYSAFEGRVFGRISELLLDVWIEQQGIFYKEIPVLFMEKQNWIDKGTSFIGRKFGLIRKNEKY